MKTIKVSQELIEEKASQMSKVYLSDILNGDFNNFPKNAVFNKSITGIGGTHLVLEAQVNSIILMPYQSVVRNKVNSFPNVFTVLEGISVDMIVEYIKHTDIIKIVSTYDGLSKLLEAYKICKLDIYSEFVLVDEWQVLYSQYLLRDNAFNLVIKETPKFKNITYMTATPIERKYWFKELSNLEEVVLDYNIQSPVVNHFKVSSIESEAVEICRSFLNKKENAHIFCNSVKFIKDVLELAELSQDNVKIVCANNRENTKKLGDFKINDTLDKVKKINFYTSTCFEGADLFDKDGNIFVFADGTKAHTLIDISGALIQIAGRIRDIKNTTVNFIYKTMRHAPGTTFEEFETACNNQKDRAIRLEKLINNSHEEIQDLLKEASDVLNSKYLRISDNKIVYDEMFVIIDELTFKIKNVYKSKANLVASLEGSNFIPVSIIKRQAESLKVENSHRTSFKEKIENYHTLQQNLYVFEGIIDPFIVECYNLIGYRRIEELNFNLSMIKALLLTKKSPDTTTQNIYKLINVSTGEFYSSKSLKNSFQTIYANLGINKTAKGSDINNYYETKEVTKTIDKKSVKGYVIIRSKMLFLK